MSADARLRVLFLVPGTGHYICGSCLRDHALANAMRDLGHDVQVAPLYLPWFLEESTPNTEIHLGGINTYLREKLPRLSRWAPGAIHRLLDKPGLLRWAARRGDMTDASTLGPLTVSMLRGEDGRQKPEVEQLVVWASQLEPVDVVVLSNAMLVSVAGPIKEALGCAVVCSLQGEAPFLDALHEPHKSEAWKTLAQRAQDIDGFLAVSRYTGNLMRDRLGLHESRVHVIWNGIDLTDFEPDPATRGAGEPRTIGYLARLCADKGLPTLIDAFLLLKKDAGFEDVRLRAAGVMLREDRALVAQLKKKLERAGLAGHVEFLPNIDREQKLEFLRTLSVFSVPATYGESFGLYLLEALASGVPVVQPHHGAFPEIVGETDGGVLCKADDPRSLASALEKLLRDEDGARAMGARGRRAVFESFSAQRMADDVAQVCRTLVAPERKTPARTHEG